jgi:hypothetical protein
MEEEHNTAVPGLAIFSFACIGFPPTNTAGFWIEQPRSKDEWVDIMPIPAYTNYAKD